MSLERIANLFRDSGFRWRFKDGDFRVPTLDDMDDAVGRAIEAIANEPDLTQIEFGRLIVRKDGQAFDVFVHLAEVTR